MRFSDFKIVETNARLQKRFDKWQAEYLTWQQLMNQSTMDTVQDELMVTSQAFDQSMKDQKAQLDREAEFFRQNGFSDQVDQFFKDLTMPMQRVDVDPVPGIAMRKTKTNESIQLNEGARIDHAEDIVFWEGSAGAKRALEAIKGLEGNGHQDVTIKWDGSPAIIFGRDESGNFVLTDKSGFTAKGYNGRSTSAEELEDMLLSRSGGKNRENPGYVAFAGKMKDIFPLYEAAVPQDYIGFFKGDLLYFNTPEKVNGNFVFTPNIVTYSVDANSELGKRIARSKTGVVIHREVDAQGNEGPLMDKDIFQGEEVLVVPPVSVERPADVDNEQVAQLEQLINRNAAGIDELLNVQELTQKQMKDFPQVLYAYTNSKVDTGLQNLGADFAQWLEQRKQISDRKKGKILEYVNQHGPAFKALWDTVSALMRVKDDIIRQFDSHDQTVKQEIGSHGPVRSDAHGVGGEGYVLAHPEGDIKLVPREYFTKANRSVER